MTFLIMILSITQVSRLNQVLAEQIAIDDIRSKILKANSSFWTDECIDCQENLDVGTDITLAVDKNTGFVHASYTSWPITTLNLYYAVRDNSGWHTQTVASGRIIASVISVDSNGFPHIGYANQFCYELFNCDYILNHLYLDGSGWHTTTIENLGNNVPLFSMSMALDSNDMPRIIAKDANSDLRYLYFENSEWKSEVVAPVGDSWYAYSSIDLEFSNKPHVSYIDTRSNDLIYAHRDVSGWITKTINSELGSIYTFNSLALDSNNIPHLSYGDAVKNTLDYAYIENNIWVSETVASNITRALPSIKLDSNDNPHIAFSDNLQCNIGACTFILYYAYHKDSGWEVEQLFDHYNASNFLSLGLDGKNNVHIGYYDRENNDARHVFQIFPENKLYLPIITNHN